MSSLTNTQINNTYPSLLKLSNSTTGITSTTQSVEDGLGGDTGLKIKQNYIGGSSLLPFKKQDTQYTMGYGIGTASSGVGTAFPAGSHNLTFGQFYYDRGNITYSAFTYAIGTVSSTSDVIEMGLYTTEYSAYGLVPKDQIGTWTLSGSDVTTTGMIKKVLPSNITLDEGGIYYINYVITNPTLVTPTVRFRASQLSNQIGAFAAIFCGWALDSGNNAYLNSIKGPTSLSQGNIYFQGISGPLPSSYNAASFNGTVATTGAPVVGFVFNPAN